MMPLVPCKGIAAGAALTSKSLALAKVGRYTCELAIENMCVAIRYMAKYDDGTD